MPTRAGAIALLRAVLAGRLYDVLSMPFHVEVNEVGETIKLLDRRPSVRTGWCRTVVDQSASLVFDDSHFPAIDCADPATRDALRALVKETKLGSVMLDAVISGAVGSVAISLKILKSRVFFQVMPSEALTPFWDPEAPDTLIRVREQYKVKGADLTALGYQLEQPDAVHWFRRDWTAEAEDWYLPWPVGEADAVPLLDPARSMTHGLGFVPLVWIRNLPGGDEIDGAPTVPDDAICTMIEADYQLSQAGRGLRYSADPKLVIVGEADTAKINVTRALLLPPEGDAKMLEINGDAVARVIDYVRCLREIAMEAMHGNRADPQKLAGAQSGRAMELMNHAMICLASRLRSAYGEGGLLSLLQMVVHAGQRLPLAIGGQVLAPGTLAATAPLTLKWPDWYALTAADRQANAQAVNTARDAGVMSIEAGVAALAHDYDIEDQATELARIRAERAEDKSRASMSDI